MLLLSTKLAPSIANTVDFSTFFSFCGYLANFSWQLAMLMNFYYEKRLILAIFFVNTLAQKYDLFLMSKRTSSLSCCFFVGNLSIAPLLPGNGGRYLVTDKRKKNSIHIYHAKLQVGGMVISQIHYFFVILVCFSQRKLYNC